MTRKFYMNRRSFLKWLGGAATLSALPPQLVRAISPARQDSNFEPDVELLMRAVKDSFFIIHSVYKDNKWFAK